MCAYVINIMVVLIIVPVILQTVINVIMWKRNLSEKSWWKITTLRQTDTQRKQKTQIVTQNTQSSHISSSSLARFLLICSDNDNSDRKKSEFVSISLTHAQHLYYMVTYSMKPSMQTYYGLTTHVGPMLCAPKSQRASSSPNNGPL